MAHKEQREFFTSVLNRFPMFFRGRRMLDVGSYDVNGNLRYMVGEGSTYLGIDVARGPNVDIVCPGHEFQDESGFDVVMSAECLEHDMHWQLTLPNMVRLLKPGGIMVVSCATSGRKEHGTSRSEPESAPALQRLKGEWSNYYRNLEEEDFRSVIDVEAEFYQFAFNCHYLVHDLYFWGIKRKVQK